MIQKVSALQVFTKSVDQELRGRILGFRAEVLEPRRDIEGGLVTLTENYTSLDK